MAEHGELRRDLLFRLRSLAIGLPPLRERTGDVKKRIVYHVDRLCKHYGGPAKGFSPDFFEALESYAWPGDVRELINAFDSAFATAGDEPALFRKHLPGHIRAHAARATFKENDSRDAQIDQDLRHGHSLPKLKDLKKTVEQRYLHNLLVSADGDIKKACEISGLSRSRLYGLLKEHDQHVSG
ncbi:hypothetical protein JXA32_07865 [Candidatus Sumerlaeota bacterium]|nr:hypothetical protein [Candidatus Sumerlaeota bacterium]